MVCAAGGPEVEGVMGPGADLPPEGSLPAGPLGTCGASFLGGRSSLLSRVLGGHQPLPPNSLPLPDGVWPAHNFPVVSPVPTSVRALLGLRVP